jgi:hypothetical protein
MTATTMAETATARTDAKFLSRILDDGYGSGAWHGPDLKAAVSDVSPAAAFHRPGPGRHNVAEIVLHHAWYVRSVANQLSGAESEPFVLTGADWFQVSDEHDLSWREIVTVLDEQQRRLSTIVSQIGGGSPPAVDDAKTLELVLGITCHAVYHAGQVQLIKVLSASGE